MLYREKADLSSSFSLSRIFHEEDVEMKLSFSVADFLLVTLSPVYSGSVDAIYPAFASGGSCTLWRSYPAFDSGG